MMRGLVFDTARLMDMNEDETVPDAMSLHSKIFDLSLYSLR